MKIALVTGGQPRFTQDFIRFMTQLTGFDQCDLYFLFWKSDWAGDETIAKNKIEKILLPKFKLKKVKIVDEPDWQSQLPTCPVPLAPPNPETITWWFKRIYFQFNSLYQASKLIEENYDVVIRYRLDGRPDRAINLQEIKLGEDFLMPKGTLSGFDDFKLNDQFAIGTQKSMEFYFNFGKVFPRYVPIADPKWYNDGINRGNWSWGTEHTLGTYMKAHNKSRVFGNFNYLINTEGRSKYTDKHYHHPIVPDPTM